MNGNVDGFHNGRLVGWAAFDKSELSSHVQVGVFSGEVLLATGLANIFRHDLKNYGVGLGDHGFSISLSEGMLEIVRQNENKIVLKALNFEKKTIASFVMPLNASALDDQNLLHLISPNFVGCYGSLDGYENGRLWGWAAREDLDSDSHVTIALFHGEEVLAQALAKGFREDVLLAGFGRADVGFELELAPDVVVSLLKNDGEITLRDVSQVDLGVREHGDGNENQRKCLSVEQELSDPSLYLREFLAPEIGDIEAFVASSLRVRRNKKVAPFIPHKKLFERVDFRTGKDLPEAMTAYSDYVRYRYKLDREFNFEDDLHENAHFLNWYLAGYSTLREGLRVPMSQEMIAWLNSPMVIGGQRKSLSQATWSFLMGVPPILHSMDFNNADWLLWVVYWWSIDQAKALNCEDVLVPQSYVELLASMPEPWPSQPWPLTQFMIRIHAQTPQLNVIDLSTEDGRKTLLMAILVLAVKRPDFLSYLPSDWMHRVLVEEGSDNSEFSGFLRSLGAEIGDCQVDNRLYSSLLRVHGYDFERRRFLTTTEGGDRFHAAQFPPVSKSQQTEVQIIGPFEKASGLGQASRLSYDVLKKTNYKINAVDFDLDNPAPEGFSRVGRLSKWKNSKINLIHLNAESVPLVFSYAPDVFSNAYNIGYFYWELDTPAMCHYLGMELLDEIWVSSEYGVEIYQPWVNEKPVSNVGMCFEEMPNLSRRTARKFVLERVGVEDSCFIFLVAFDSFSFVQRKNPIGTLRAFKKAFEGVQNAKLVIKTQNRSRVQDPVQKAIWHEVDVLCLDDPRIEIIDETLAYKDLLRLKKGSDCYISLHKSEGWGFGMIEAMNLGVPVIATAYSGNLEFCTSDTSWLVQAEVVELGPDDYIFVQPGQRWAEPDIDDAARQMRAVFEDHVTREVRSQAAREFVQEYFSPGTIAERYKTRLDEIFQSF